MEKLLFLGTGSSINEHAHKLSTLDIDIFAWGHAWEFCRKQLKKYPKYWGFIDWHSVKSWLQKIGDEQKKTGSTLFVLSPVLNKTLDTQLKYIGTPQGIKSKDEYLNYVKLLRYAKKYINIVEIPATSTKYLGTNPITLLNNKVVIQEQDGADKLHSVILPLLTYLQDKINFKHVHFVGFEGIGPRYNTKKEVVDNIKDIQRIRERFLPQWMDILKFKPYTLTRSDYLHFAYYSMESLCKKFS
jgi:hypothetical protein